MGRRYAAFNTYVTRHGDGAVPQRHVTDDGLNLGKWVAKQRSKYLAGTLDHARTEQLTATPGWIWDARDAAFNQRLTLLRRFVAETGNWPSKRVTYDGQPLGQWLADIRKAGPDKTTLTRRAALEALPGFQWTVDQETARLRSNGARSGYRVYTNDGSLTAAARRDTPTTADEADRPYRRHRDTTRRPLQPATATNAAPIRNNRARRPYSLRSTGVLIEVRVHDEALTDQAGLILIAHHDTFTTALPALVDTLGFANDQPSEFYINAARTAPPHPRWGHVPDGYTVCDPHAKISDILARHGDEAYWLFDFGDRWVFRLRARDAAAHDSAAVHAAKQQLGLTGPLPTPDSPLLLVRLSGMPAQYRTDS